MKLLIDNQSSQPDFLIVSIISMMLARESETEQVCDDLVEITMRIKISSDFPSEDLREITARDLEEVVHKPGDNETIQ